jgi:hypothetical protein
MRLGGRLALRPLPADHPRTISSAARRVFNRGSLGLISTARAQVRQICALPEPLSSPNRGPKVGLRPNAKPSRSAVGRRSGSRRRRCRYGLGGGAGRARRPLVPPPLPPAPRRAPRRTAPMRRSPFLARPPAARSALPRWRGATLRPDQPTKPFDQVTGAPPGLTTSQRPPNSLTFWQRMLPGVSST